MHLTQARFPEGLHGRLEPRKQERTNLRLQPCKQAPEGEVLQTEPAYARNPRPTALQPNRYAAKCGVATDLAKH
jgi:hypothetical protein